MDILFNCSLYMQQKVPGGSVDIYIDIDIWAGPSRCWYDLVLLFGWLCYRYDVSFYYLSKTFVDSNMSDLRLRNLVLLETATINWKEESSNKWLKKIAFHCSFMLHRVVNSNRDHLLSHGGVHPAVQTHAPASQPGLFRWQPWVRVGGGCVRCQPLSVLSAPSKKL